ncbi:PREDICTED: neuropeptide W [Elephantulus edwardii]|uniref:neuropeptide W n=1 Tax=Elephantulus edwardii TaxID=28737 RepID=UPI0003F094F4|nr:PREDICTED: neuropeptide W [Elephantulus edwardii]
MTRFQLPPSRRGEAQHRLTSGGSAPSSYVTAPPNTRPAHRKYTYRGGVWGGAPEHLQRPRLDPDSTCAQIQGSQLQDCPAGAMDVNALVPGALWGRHLLLLLLLLAAPTDAWYKHAGSPRYHTVGRAAGLLMGLRRAPSLWRRALLPPAGPGAWDTVALGAPGLGRPQGSSATDALLQLPSRVPEQEEAAHKGTQAELPKRVPWNARDPDPDLR